MIQDYDFECGILKHPEIVWPVLGLAIISCLVVWISVSCVKVSSPPVKITNVSNRSGELINYSIPYMISFFVIDLENTNLLLSFAFFMVIMFWMTMKTHNIFINPILTLLGYNLYEVRYENQGVECENFFLVKDDRLQQNDKCRITELSEKLFLVTERNPEV